VATRKTRSGVRGRGRRRSVSEATAQLGSVEKTLIRIREALNAARRDFAVIGGFAVSARSMPRFTRDVDLAVDVEDDADAEALIGSLTRSGYRLVATVEQTAADRLATARIEDKTTRVIVDLLFASSGIEAEIVQTADPIDLLPGVTLDVARVSSLIALKLLSRDDRRRPQDADDLRHLLAQANRRELARARKLAALITERGYARGRDLAALLDQAIEHGVY
jgi:predicted nucleotidyltransferase